MLKKYLNSTIGAIFKILPLKERESEGEQVYLESYIKSLLIDLRGAGETFPELRRHLPYFSLLNILGGINIDELSVPQCKKEVFDMISLVTKLSDHYKEESCEH